MKERQRSAGLFQLSPFFVFIGLFLVSTFFIAGTISPVVTCTIAIVFSFFTFREKMSLNEKIKIFIQGSCRPTMMTMFYIYIFASAFTYALKIIGGLDAAVKIGMKMMPGGYILPGFFVLVSLFAMAIGSSMGSIAAFLPIGLGVAQKIGIDPALMSGLVVSGAMLGDNLSIISDTTVAATQTTDARMLDKFKENIALVVPGFILTLITLIVINYSYIDTIGSYSIIESLNVVDFVLILPYLLVFVLALIGIDVIAVLVSSIVFSAIIGWWFGKFSLLAGSALLVEGFSKDTNIHEVVVFAFLVGGLSYIIEYNGGINYLLDCFTYRIKSTFGAEISIGIVTMLVTAAVALNTVAILVAGPVARHIAEDFNITPSRTACLLDIFACIAKGILPYGSQLLLAGSLAGVTTTSIIPHLHYQGFMFIVMIISIVKKGYFSKKVGISSSGM